MTPSAREGVPQDAVNLHATAVVLGDRCVLISGPLGGGKTTLALALVAHWSNAGAFARLVGDDQVFVAERGGRLIAMAPAAIAGLAEARGFGPAGIGHEPAAIVDLAVELVEAAGTERLQVGATRRIASLEVPHLTLPARNVTQAVIVVAAALGVAPFVSRS